MAVYFIRSGNHIKIGTSADPWLRMAALQTGTPEPLEMLAIAPGGVELERGLHDAFREDNLRGEWFEIGERLTAFIDTVRKTFPDIQHAPHRPAIGREGREDRELTPAELEIIQGNPIYGPVNRPPRRDEVESRFGDFIRATGRNVVYNQDLDRVVVSVPDARIVGAPDDWSVALVDDPGEPTPMLGREKKLRTASERLDEAVFALLMDFRNHKAHQHDWGVCFVFSAC